MFIQMEFTRGMQRKAYAEAMGKHSSLGTLDKKKGAQHFTLVLHSAVFNGKEYKIKTCSEVMFASLPQPSVSPLTSGNNVTYGMTSDLHTLLVRKNNLSSDFPLSLAI